MKNKDVKANEATYEELRIEALESYQILDTPFEQEFDDIVNLAAHICQTPIALVSFVDRERQWFKAAHGLAARETARSVSFCAHAIKGTELFIVPDATLDARFKENALVTGQPNVVFYAGAPIINEDHQGLGSICVIDNKPRELSTDQLEALRALSRQVNALLLSRKRAMHLREASAKVEKYLVASRQLLQQRYNAALEAANQSEIEFRAIFDSLAIGVAQVHPTNGMILRCNQTYARMVGYGEDELRTMSVHQLTHADDRAQNVTHLDRLADTRDKVLQHEKRYVHKDGHPIWVRTTAVLVCSPDGLPMHITGVLTDITAERSAIEEKGEALKQASMHKETLALATTTGKIGIWEWEFATDVLKMNDINRDIYELPGHVTTGQQILAQLLPEDVLKVNADVAQSKIDKKPYHSEFRIRRKNGELRTLLASGSIQYDNDDQPYRMVGVNIDVTDARKAQAESANFEIQARSANESSRLKSEFLANMSHEIRTPINGIIGMTKLLQDTVQNAEQQRFTNSIATSSSILLTLINDILDLSKVESGKLDLEIVPFDARKLIEALRESFEPLFQTKGVALEIEYLAKDAIFVGDSSRVLQILNNLMSNALKFTSKGKVRLEIKDQLRFTVTDSGIGMTPQICANLFQKFSQGDASTARKFGGTGLGLAISKHLCTMMGGKISVESQEGKGSTFTFDIPLRLASSDEKSSFVQNRLSASNSYGKAERQKFSILVAEDNFINQEITMRALSKNGYRATAVSNGLQTLTAMVSAHYDLILMDCQMPEMDGFEATIQLRKKGFQLPIVALTANAFQEDRERCLASGMTDYLSKPVSDEVLLGTVDRLLGAKTQHPFEPSTTSASATLSDASALNMTQLRDLQVLDPDGKDGFVQNLISVYCESAPRILIEMKAADAAKRAKLAHSLKSTSANLGATKIAVILKAIEFGKIEASELPAQFEQLAKEISSACAELKAYAAALGQSRAS